MAYGIWIVYRNIGNDDLKPSVHHPAVGCVPTEVRFVSVRMASMALLVILLASGSGNGQGQEEHLQSQSLLTGYKRYNATCGHCHGPDGVGGSFAPSLISRASDLASFRAVVTDGIGSKMPGYRDDLNVAPYIDDIQRYLQARAEGRIGRGRPGR
jgi:mono/diheme cytochrome c family protein